MVDLKGKPFCLQEEEIAWVEKTMTEMTLEEKIGQLFCPIGLSTDREELKEKYLKYHIGGIMFRDQESGKEIAQIHNFLQENSKIPLLLAANLESGGNGIAKDGTNYGCQMLVAATNEAEYAYELGKISAREGAACGCNWAFAPVADIDYNFRNPITNIRTYGSDAKRVEEMTSAYMRGVMECGMAVAAKHFPGDGVDERDQHIVTSVNSLSCEEWDNTYGNVYRRLITEGAMTIMVGHIALPAYQKEMNPGGEKILPATLSEELLQGLLRKKLGFQGVISTDATQMVGFCCAMKREEAVPLSIERGCDVFLFHHSLEEDYQFMLNGYKKGLLSKKRLEEAVTRILALKAALKLPQKQKEHSLVCLETVETVVGCPEHVKAAKKVAQKGVTLVKDTQGLLPLSVKRYPRLLLQVMENNGQKRELEQQFKELFEAEGFQVSLYTQEEGVVFCTEKTADFISSYDLVVYIMNIENKSNHTTCRIQWDTTYAGNNQPWFVEELPTMMISLANPYHLLDAPMIKTYINAYCNSPYTREAVLEKVMGRSTFQGISPIDAFCGREDTRS